MLGCHGHDTHIQHHIPVSFLGGMENLKNLLRSIVWPPAECARGCDVTRYAAGTRLCDWRVFSGPQKPRPPASLHPVSQKGYASRDYARKNVIVSEPLARFGGSSLLLLLLLL